MDTLTNIRTEGTGVPMADPNMIAQMAPPPQGPMMDPQMGGVDPVAELMAAQQGGQGAMDDSMSVEGDAAMLAETVVERAQGDINAAVAILDTAKAMLVQGAGAPPQGGQGAMEAPIMAKDGAYLYRQDGGTISDTDVLKQMIMDSLQNTKMGILGPYKDTSGDVTAMEELARLAAANSPEGRTLSYKDSLLELARLAAAANSQEGREITDKDLAFHLKMLGGQQGRTLSDRDIGQQGRTLSDRDLANGGYMKKKRYANGGAINPELKRIEQAEFSRGMQALANRFS